MKKSGSFSKIKIALFIGGFYSTVLMMPAMALDHGCPDCYRCANFISTTNDCWKCVYDENYCGEVSDIPWEECEDGYYQDEVTGECVPDEEIDFSCLAGQYVGDGTCEDCPTLSSCTIDSSGSEGINSCYVVANSCSLSDSKGVYKYTSDCYYN